MTVQYPTDEDTIAAEQAATDELADQLAVMFERWAHAIRRHETEADPVLVGLLRSVPFPTGTDLVLASRLIGELAGNNDSPPPKQTAEYRMRAWCNSCAPTEGPLIHMASGRVSPCRTETRSVAVCGSCGREFVLVATLSQTNTASAQRRRGAVGS